jgi:hypothetical protein
VDGGTLLAAAAEDGRVLVWDADNGSMRQELRLFAGPGHAVKHAVPATGAVAVGDLDGRTVVAAATGTTARVWDAGDGTLVHQREWLAPAWAPVALAFTERSVLVAHRTEDGLDVFDAVDGAVRLRLPAGEPWSLTPEFVHPSGREPLLAVMSDSGLDFVDLDGGEPPWPRIEGRWITSCAVGRLGDVDVCALPRDDGIGLWNLVDGTPYGPGIAHRAGRLAFVNVRGRDLLLSGHSATVRAWHPRTGRLVSELPFGTLISSFAAMPQDGGNVLVAVSGPGVAVAELRSLDEPDLS